MAHEAAEGDHVAIIFGVTGLVGKELARNLASRKRWKIYGVARRPGTISFRLVQYPNYHFISCDLLNPLEAQEKLSSLRDVTHVFWVTWASQFPLDSEECCEQNKAMMGNALNALLPVVRNLRHVSLQTGTKHYVSLQGPFDRGEVIKYDEESPRVGGSNNFYYALEDLLKERLGGRVAWSVHRPGLIMGSSQRAVFNFMGGLCVYGAICKHLNLPFVFGGTKESWEEGCVDGSDARLAAEQHVWAATSEETYSGDGQAFNAINGTGFIWRRIWPAVGLKLGVEVKPQDMFSEEFSLTAAMGDKEGVWKEIVEKEGLVQTEMRELANWAFMDMLFRCPVKMLATRDKADGLGFTLRYETLDSILYWIDFMRTEKLIP